MSNHAEQPWYLRSYRWGQTNLTEIDPTRYDSAWWREHWRRTRVQGVIVNAGGIVAYYPSKYPLHYRAAYLEERDLYGDIVRAAREEGLAVLARMDSNRTDERLYLEHPDWFARDAEGRPYRAGERYITCINSPYYQTFLPAILQEIIERTHPDGITDNSWSGLGRSSICYCVHCQRQFKETTGHALPRKKDWESEAYRQWIVWNYARRVALWEHNNRVTQDAGGPDCLWLGMNDGDIISQSHRFRDYKAICERSEILMLDSQSRTARHGFQSNGEAGKLIHSLLGWDKLIPESMAMYQHGKGEPTFRVASKPEAEARMWMVEGFAGGIQPWWHHIGAYHEDRRQYRTAEPLFRWHADNEQYLTNRQPVASVGVVWSHENVDFYGRDAARERIDLPHQGIVRALMRARIPYLPVHIDHIEREAERLKLLILPNLGALSDAHAERIRRFVQAGGGLLASGETSLYDEWGDRREDFALADLFGVHATASHHGSAGAHDVNWETWAQHSYLRLTPELRSRVDGPQIGSEPAIAGERHPVLAGFDETDILPFGGRLEVVQASETAQVPMTLIPPFPIYPPETSWMRHPSSHLPGLVLNEPFGSRVAYLPTDLDRCFGRDNLLDHGDVLENLIRWTSRNEVPLHVDGPGFIDCHLYRQAERLVLHLVNLTSAGTWRAPVHELIAVGPLHVRVHLPDDLSVSSATLRVAATSLDVRIEDGWMRFTVPSVTDHELIVMA